MNFQPRLTPLVRAAGVAVVTILLGSTATICAQPNEPDTSAFRNQIATSPDGEQHSEPVRASERPRTSTQPRRSTRRRAMHSGRKGTVSATAAQLSQRRQSNTDPAPVIAPEKLTADASNDPFVTDHAAAAMSVARVQTAPVSEAAATQPVRLNFQHVDQPVADVAKAPAILPGARLASAGQVELKIAGMQSSTTAPPADESPLADIPLTESRSLMVTNPFFDNPNAEVDGHQFNNTIESESASSIPEIVDASDVATNGSHSVKAIVSEVAAHPASGQQVVYESFSSRRVVPVAPERAMSAVEPEPPAIKTAAEPVSQLPQIAQGETVQMHVMPPADQPAWNDGQFFIDPERFRVSSAEASRMARATGPRFPAIAQEVEETEQRTTEDNKLLSSMPAGNLRGGIDSQSMERTTFNRDIQNANEMFVYDPQMMLAPDMRPEAIPTGRTWRTPNMYHGYLMFEDANLERYGHTHPKMQPFLSGAHFFTSVALLPYKTVVANTDRCVYSLGYYRPGDCNPAYRDCPPIDRRAALKQSLLTAGLLIGL